MSTDVPASHDPHAPGGNPVTTVAVSLPKKGHAPDENEDAFSISAPTFPVRAAVADGATESVYAGIWADALVRQLCRVDLSSDDDAWDEALRTARQDWANAVDAPSEAVPWYVEEKRRQGAFATALGLVLHGDGSLHARAVGDGVLIRRRDGEQTAWPIDDPDVFSNRPPLLSSRLDGSTPPAEAWMDTWKPADVYLLATDAVAAWILVNTPDIPSEPGAIEHALRRARDTGTLRNDDLTLIRIDVVD